MPKPTKREKYGGRKAGIPNKRTAVLDEAKVQAKAKVAEDVEIGLLPDFDGNALAFLQMIYRSAKFSTESRFEAAHKALPYETPKPVPTSAVVSDLPPLHERIREYAREEAITASEGKIVELRR